VTWLSRVATNIAYRQLQWRLRERVYDPLASPYDNRFPIFTAPIRDPESCVRDREARVILQRALAKLPLRYQLIFLMKDVREIATPEIARSLNVRQNNVRLQVHRARRMLRRTIEYDYR